MKAYPAGFWEGVRQAPGSSRFPQCARLGSVALVASVLTGFPLVALRPSPVPSPHASQGLPGSGIPVALGLS